MRHGLCHEKRQERGDGVLARGKDGMGARVANILEACVDAPASCLCLH